MFINVNYDHLKLTQYGLNYGEILLYSYVYSFFENSDDCFPSNKYLSGVFNTSERNIQKWLNKLKEKELIEVVFEVDKNDKMKRYLIPHELSVTRSTNNCSW